MGKDSPTPHDVFDVRKIRRLVELMNDHELAEIDLQQADQRIRLRRDVDPIVAPAQVATAQAPVAIDAAATPAASEESGTVIKSPIIGTFYPASSPDEAPYVKVGDTVDPETTVCIIEAMKVFNEIPAECSGKITAILCQNGDAVEYGQPLFRVDPGV
jgi:acetyl-CoA carboxylase biotin carboxyl carrier protein